MLLIKVIFLFFLLVISGYVIYDIYRLRPSEIPFVPSDTTCSENGIMKAWLEEVIAPSNCPDYTNKLVVENSILMTKKLGVSPGCCFFSEEDKEIVISPFICNAMVKTSLTDDELNITPYKYDNGVIEYYNHTCQTEDCISLMSVGDGKYVISKYNYRKTNPGVAESVITLTNNCRGITSYTVNGDEQLIKDNNGNYFVKGGAPNVVTDILTAYNRNKGFYPVPIVPLT